MILCEEEFPKILTEIASFLQLGDVELIFTDNKTMQEINNEHRKQNKTTDVLSFPYDLEAGFLCGSIVINKELASTMANELTHSIEDEIALLFVHAALHILGFDHEIDNGQMRAKEEEIIKKFNLPQSLIIRNS